MVGGAYQGPAFNVSKAHLQAYFSVIVERFRSDKFSDWKMLLGGLKVLSQRNDIHLHTAQVR